LVPQRLWILTPQQGAAAAQGIPVVIHHRIHPLDRQHLRPIAGMTWLTPALATTAFALLLRLNPGPLLEGWFGGIGQSADDPLPQTRQLFRHGSELDMEPLDLLLLSENERTNGGRGSPASPPLKTQQVERISHPILY
jgi:hypothetical protein